MRDCGLKMIVTTSEILTDVDRKAIADAFGVPVYDSYGLREGGLVGHECDRFTMHCMDEQLILETIDPDTLQPTDGEGELVLTNIVSKVMPMIRYRTGDIVTLSNDPCPCGRNLGSIRISGGRVADFVVTNNGTWIPGYAFIYICRSVKGIVNFQLHSGAERAGFACCWPPMGTSLPTESSKSARPCENASTAATKSSWNSSTTFRRRPRASTDPSSGNLPRNCGEAACQWNSAMVLRPVPFRALPERNAESSAALCEAEALLNSDVPTCLGIARRQLDYLRRLNRLCELKLGVLAQPAQFVFVGATGAIVDLAVFTLLLRVTAPHVGRAIAIWIAMTWNFGLNRRLTFSHARNRPIHRQYAIFCMSCILGALISWSVFAWLHSAVGVFAERPVIAAAVGIVVGTISKFLMSKHIAFK